MADPPAESTDDPILVSPDAVIAKLLPKFLANRQRDVALIVEMLEREGYGELEVMGHNLKGAGRGYGCDGISEIGRALEEAAQKHDQPAIRSQAFALDDYLRRVRIAPWASGRPEPSS